MNYQSLVPSKELCKKLQTLNICQDEPELYWYAGYDPRGDGFFSWSISEKNKRYIHHKKGIIAPTLPRLMEKLPERTFVTREEEGWWVVQSDDETIETDDKHLPNAVSKALIALAERKYDKIK